MGSQVLVSRPTGSWPERGSQKLACHFKPKQLKLALVLGAPPMDPFFYSEEAGAKGLPPLSPAPQIPAQPKPSLRNAVRLPSGIDVHLHRNTHSSIPFVQPTSFNCFLACGGRCW